MYSKGRLFTEHQYSALSEALQEYGSKPNDATIETVAQRVNLSFRQVKQWFCRKRFEERSRRAIGTSRGGKRVSPCRLQLITRSSGQVEKFKSKLTETETLSDVATPSANHFPPPNVQLTDVFFSRFDQSFEKVISAMQCENRRMLTGIRCENQKMLGDVITATNSFGRANNLKAVQSEERLDTVEAKLATMDQSIACQHSKIDEMVYAIKDIREKVDSLRLEQLSLNSPESMVSGISSIAKNPEDQSTYRVDYLP